MTPGRAQHLVVAGQGALHLLAVVLPAGDAVCAIGAVEGDGPTGPVRHASPPHYWSRRGPAPHEREELAAVAAQPQGQRLTGMALVVRIAAGQHQRAVLQLAVGARVGMHRSRASPSRRHAPPERPGITRAMAVRASMWRERCQARPLGETCTAATPITMSAAPNHCSPLMARPKRNAARTAAMGNSRVVNRLATVAGR